MTAVEEVVQIPFFQGIPAEALREIAAQSTILTLEAGRTFISQHAAAEHVFFLISGSVHFYIHFHGVDDLLVGTMRQPGALLGWSVVRKPHRYTATVRCEEECRVLRLPRDVLISLDKASNEAKDFLTAEPQEKLKELAKPESMMQCMRPTQRAEATDGQVGHHVSVGGSEI